MGSGKSGWCESDKDEIGGRNIISVLVRLGLSCHVCIQRRTLHIWADTRGTRAAEDEDADSRVVSSANNETPGYIQGKSFTCATNKRGPSMEPWGTPEDTGRGSELMERAETNCDRLLR